MAITMKRMCVSLILSFIHFRHVENERTVYYRVCATMIMIDKTSESEQQKLDEIDVTGGVSIFAPKS